ncbi:Uncharacterized protein M6B38_238765 [Iris pallida]|uniref:Uncharacterized protein n=1 Tax=Iris pallida TaxID=29817 RepID=A0AAX6DLH5_IRIPA|nr:Uncharacterized protein M6B38_238765 [Iris pallida]
MGIRSDLVRGGARRTRGRPRAVRGGGTGEEREAARSCLRGAHRRGDQFVEAGSSRR